MRPVTVAVVFVVCFAGALRAKEPAAPDFRKDVAPIFTKYCTGCHGSFLAEGELNLESHALLMKGGKNGAAVVPGKPDKSRLILQLEGKAEPAMPPEGNERPNENEIALLKAWIKAGAPGPKGDEPATLEVPTIELRAPARRPVYAVAFSPDGKQVAIGRDGIVEIRSANTRELIKTLDGHTGQVNDVGFSADGKLLFAAAGQPGLFGEITLWLVESGKRLRVIKAHNDSLYAAALSRDGSILATAGYDAAIKLWNVETEKGSGERQEGRAENTGQKTTQHSPLHTLDVHNGAVFDLAFHPGGRYLASASEDFTVKLWDAESGRRTDTLNEPTKPQQTAAFSPDGRLVAAGGVDNRIRVWRMNDDGTARIEYSRFAHEAPLLKLVFSPDGRLLISSAQDRSVKVWETAGFTQVAVLERQPDWAPALAVSPDGRALVVGRLDGSLETYRLDGELARDEHPRVSTRGYQEQAPAPGDSGETKSVAEVAEAEPNDDPAEATALRIPAVADGVLNPINGQSHDVDLYAFDAEQGEAWIIETRAARDGSPADTKIEVLHEDGRPVERLWLRAVRDSWITFRPIDSSQNQVRVENWEEMELNQYMYMNGEVCKLFRKPQGPDSGFLFYTVGGKRRCYFDTSGTVHAKDEPVYIVEPYRPGTELADNGLPVFPLYYANDDDGQRKLGRDSRLTFTPPAAGRYLVRVSDVRGFGGEDFKYRLIVRRPQPDFEVNIAGKGATVAVGSGQRLTFTLTRKDNFEGPVRIDIENVPSGFSIATPIVVQAGHLQARSVVNASPDLPAPEKPQPAPGDWSKVKVTATATIGGKTVRKDLGNLGDIKLAPKPKVLVHLWRDDASQSSSPSENPDDALVIAPETTITAMLAIERNGFDGELKFDVDNLPHGVIVDNIGLNGILIREKENRRRIFLSAEEWVPETTRSIHAVTKGQGNQASWPIILRISR